MARGFESKLVEDSLFGLSKRTNVDDSTVCSCVSLSLTWIDLNPRESGSVIGVGQLVHVHCLEERMIRPLLSFTIITALICLVPSARLPVAQTPAARFPVVRTPLVTRFTLAPSIHPVVVVVVLVPTMNPSVAIVITLPDIGPRITIVIPVPRIVPTVMR